MYNNVSGTIVTPTTLKETINTLIKKVKPLNDTINWVKNYIKANKYALPPTIKKKPEIQTDEAINGKFTKIFMILTNIFGIIILIGIIGRITALISSDQSGAIFWFLIGSIIGLIL